MKMDADQRKERIIAAVIDLLEEKGIQGLSTKEIANRVHISEGTLFKYFRSKTEIVLAALDHYASRDQEIITSIQKNNLEFDDAIYSYIIGFAMYLDNYPAITSLLFSYEFLRNEPALAEKSIAIISYRKSFIRDLMIEAQEKGRLSLDSNPVILTDMLLGFLKETILQWRINKYSFDVITRLRDFLDLFLSCSVFNTRGK